MLLLYYTNTILFWFGLPSFNPRDGLTKNVHQHDFQYLPQEVCIARCLGRSDLRQTTTEPTKYLAAGSVVTTPMLLELCVDNCSKLNSTQNSKPVKRVQENYSLNLICRDESSLNFRINIHKLSESADGRSRTKETDMTHTVWSAMSPIPNSSTVATTTLSSSSIAATAEAASSSSTSPSTSVNDDDGGSEEDVVLFVIKMHLANETEKFFVYLSDENFFTINQLAPNATYNISALAVHSTNKYSVIALEQQFKTLRRAYTPGNVTDIKVTDFIEDKDSRMHLSALMTWKPPPDMTCHYDIICFSPESEDYDLQPLEIRNPRHLYKYQLENLTFSSVYKVGIRARNTKNMKESELFWKTFRAPSCVEWHNYNFNICAPDAPKNLYIDQMYVEQNVYSFNISWEVPVHPPDNYTLFVTDLSPQGRRVFFNISKDIHNYFIDRIEIHGMLYEVSLTAFTVGGSATTAVTDVTKTIVHIPEKNHVVKLIAVILAPIFCVAILAMAIFIVYHRRAKLKRYQERCKYFEELEKKAPIDPKDNFDFGHALNGGSCNSSGCKQPTIDACFQLDNEEVTLFNDEMEIDRNQLTMYEVLGEGAFGLVKRGIYKDATTETAYEVAVKMLKDHPTSDDVRAFRREIEVMKSVGKHPNIVGLIGHCTRFSKDMMLLTEYCSFGNLLDFLRDEWRFLHEIHQRKQSFSSTVLDMELSPVHVKGPKRLCELDVFIEDALPSPPPPPPPLSPPLAQSTAATSNNQPPTLDNNDKRFQENKQTLELWQNVKNNQCNNSNFISNMKPSNNNMDNGNGSGSGSGNNNAIGNVVDNVDLFEINGNSQIVIERFKRKYNDLNCNSNSNSSNSNDSSNTIDNDNLLSSRDHLYGIEDIGANNRDRDSTDLTTAIHVSFGQQQHQVATPSSATILSPATENKSYGYHGCCTNSCKCKVDVIIRNIDSSDSSKDNEELDLLLRQREQQKHSSNQTKIAIQNCDCRHGQQSHRYQATATDADEKLRHKSAVENKAYFKCDNADARSTSRKRRLMSLALKTTTSAITVNTSTSTPRNNSLPPDNEEAWTTPRVPLTTGDFLDIARQVAVGMDFLSKNKVVHRDLAARNVLVAPDRTIKIADFGLSRDVYQENIYKKTGNGKLPIKWLALESLTHQVYTTQSDVWSYGILLYEIVTLGATPYPSIPTNRLLHLLKTGYRMEKPKNCDQNFYDLMYSCWNGTPGERPTFSEIIEKLNQMLHDLQITEHSPLAEQRETCTLRREEDNGIDDELSKQESPIQQICGDDSYLKPL